jgi:hypothetical protein
MIPMYLKWQKLPKRFVEYYELILSAKTVGELRSISHLLISSTREFIAGFKPKRASQPVEPNFNELSEWYQEMRTTWNRIYHYCKSNNSDAVFIDVCGLQNELSIINDDFNFMHSFNIEERFGLVDFDLLGAYDVNNLKPLAARAEQLEKIIISVIEDNGVKIRKYDTLDDFIFAENNMSKLNCL